MLKTETKFLAETKLKPFRFAHYSRQRREDLFKLSQPGGHPRNWDGVSSAALKVVDDLMSDLNKTSGGGQQGPNSIRYRILYSIEYSIEYPILFLQ